VRKIKPTICLRIGMSKPEAPSPTNPTAANRIANANRKHSLISQLLGHAKLSIPCSVLKLA
jgi:hypothetical protein